jgi:hypothetical protein
LLPSDADPNVYERRSADGTVVAVIYVDDGIIVADTDADADAAIADIAALFPCRDMGEPRDYVGWQVERDRAAGTIKIHSADYIRRLLHEYGMTGCAPVALPMTKLPHEQGEPLPLPERHRYPRLIGALLHAANCTRPDIAQPVATLARYLKAPKLHHWAAALRVLRYLAGTISLGIVYGGRADLLPEAFSDADWAGDDKTRRSRSGGVFLSNGGATWWHSKLQPTVSGSTMEAEYIACDAVVREAMFQRKLWPVLTGRALGPVPISTDSECALALLANPMNTVRSKHIDIKYKYARECAVIGAVSFCHVDGVRNIADILTKPLPSLDKFTFCVRGMGMR